ncbi:heme transporter CcmD [Streptococcus panodentis]|uniref:Heme transporter CcmD n=1 Tax=Streptococcus panodentis TaxID=1581472 RepID=A0ABS5AW18_9STRE|nr:heme transporter CcmD [Streptococcus panodentis]MBP2620750.1 heme transporter CcmD [Streptococcus panodentis]
MYDTNDEPVLEVSEASLSRSEQAESQPAKLEPVPYVLAFLCSLILSLLSVVNPLLTHLSTNLQSQNLYAGWAMSQGQLPYSQIYGTSGLLYYFILWAGSLVFGQFLLIAFQTLALWLAGIFLHRTVARLRPKQGLSRSLLLLFYLLVFALGFGGLYSTIFVFPFIFWNLSFLVRYLQDDLKDEKFILYGAFGAVAFMIEPMVSLVFYALTSLVLFVYNIVSKQKARGFYQFLAALLGFSLIFYPLGYFTVVNQTFGQAISQVTYAWDSFNLLGSHLLGNLLYYGLLTVGLGFASAFAVGLFTKAESTSTRVLRFIGLLGLLATVLGALGLPDQGSYQLLPALPFAMILLALWFNKGKKQAGRHRRDRRQPSLWSSYIAGQFFLPLLALLYLVGYPLVNEYLLSSGQSAERARAAQYIQEKSSTDDKVYAWDNSASLYQASGRKSAVSLLSPALYLGTAENRLGLQSALENVQPKFILVNNHLELLSDTRQNLSKNYKETDLKLSHFKLYELK